MNPSLQLIKTNGQKPLRIRKKLNTPRKKFTPSEDEDNKVLGGCFPPAKSCD